MGVVWVKRALSPLTRTIFLDGIFVGDSSRCSSGKCTKAARLCATSSRRRPTNLLVPPTLQTRRRLLGERWYCSGLFYSWSGRQKLCLRRLLRYLGSRGRCHRPRCTISRDIEGAGVQLLRVLFLLSLGAFLRVPIAVIDVAGLIGSGCRGLIYGVKTLEFDNGVTKDGQ